MPAQGSLFTKNLLLLPYRVKQYTEVTWRPGATADGQVLKIKCQQILTNAKLSLKDL